MTPIIDRILSDTPHSVTLLLIGDTAEDMLYESAEYAELCVSLSFDICVQGWKKDQVWSELSQSELKKLMGCVSPRAIISGTSTRVQSQIVESFVSSDASIVSVAYFTDMIWKWNSTASDLFHNSSVWTEVWTESESMTEAFEVMGGDMRDKVHTVGDAFVSTWMMERSNETNGQILREIERELDVKLYSKDLIAFVGTSGDGYLDSLEQFLKYGIELKLLERYDVIIASSPEMYLSRLEEKLVRRLKLSNQVHVLPANPIPGVSLSAIRASLVSLFVVSQDSNANIIALMLGKPTLFFQSGSGMLNNSINTGVVKDVVPLVTDQTSLQRWISTFSSQGFQFNVSRLDGIGVPKNGLDNAYNRWVHMGIENEYDREDTIRLIAQRKATWCIARYLSLKEKLIISGIVCAVAFLMVVVCTFAIGINKYCSTIHNSEEKEELLRKT